MDQNPLTKEEAAEWLVSLGFVQITGLHYKRYNQEWGQGGGRITATTRPGTISSGQDLLIVYDLFGEVWAGHNMISLSHDFHDLVVPHGHTTMPFDDIDEELDPDGVAMRMAGEPRLPRCLFGLDAIRLLGARAWASRLITDTKAQAQKETTVV